MDTTGNLTDTGVGSVVTEPKPRRISKTLGNLIRKAENMASGIQEHLATLSPKLDEADIQALNNLSGEINGLDNDQEIYKGKLKEKTMELEVKVQQMKDVIGQYTMIIKAVIPQKRWVDFGIGAKR